MKNILITGGTSGVGFAIAQSLAGPRTHLIIVGRNQSKGLSAIDALGPNTAFVSADLSTAAGLTILTDFVKSNVDHLDALVLSAGVMPIDQDQNIQTNLVSHFNVVTGLKPLLTGGKILLVTGNPQAVQRMPICEMQNTQVARAGWLLTHKTLLMVYLAATLEDQNITVNSFFPGDVHSDLMPYTRSLTKTAVPVGKYLLTEPSLASATGTFFDDQGQVVPLNPRKYSLAEATKVLSQYLPI
ncbi:SDR family NAD(P)-dependent oxidoreductase [Fructobacillus ficulneus]|uniref:Short-chain dehydrogenase/oxidoreductase n=1 Tax=Fructobacillus ficulneus TaxID=157463 RepID=A0A0K8MHH1_9LACO|nr:SDR family NAD(P)-dependent oxidoreductase [Fructobacillus ficulneus]GAO99922.1 short-chain dehydrogenase/oxidoreductase [Fructobacillus ficulneus]